MSHSINFWLNTGLEPNQFPIPTKLRLPESDFITLSRNIYRTEILYVTPVNLPFYQEAIKNKYYCKHECHQRSRDNKQKPEQ